MPENFTESKHLASLDFDISKIFKQLEEIENLLMSKGLSLQQIIKNNFRIDDDIAKQINAAAKQLRNLDKELTVLKTNHNGKGIHINVGIDEALNKIKTLRKEINNVQAGSSITSTIAAPQINAQSSSNTSKSFASEIASKTRWYAAGSAAFAGGYVAKETIQTLNDVEYKVMEITRVMEDSTLNVQSFRQSLFGLATEYGTSFEDVSEIALRFAQAGYNVNDTIKMTKDSLLALNTAELSTESSTQSMIGILSQWNMGANDMSLVIDKINKTGDDYAITSQDLVDGLLRSSMAAKNAKMSFNEAVGAITALRTASGRSGSEVGNALNSLIAYTQRDKSLKTFESLGVKVYTDEARTQLTPLLEMWGQLSEKVKAGGDAVVSTISQQTELSSLYNEELAIATDTQDEYTAAIQAENAANQEGLTDLQKRAAYESAGMYRRNYFMALLNNFAQIQEVVNNLENAEGYSMQENGRTMETLEKKYNSLIAALKNLAVEAGDGGLVGLAKGALDLATALTKASSSGLGMSVLLASIALSYTLLSKEAKVFGIYSIASWKEMGQAVLAAGTKIKAYATGQKVAATATEATTATIALQNAALTFGLSIAIQLIIGLYQNWVTNNKTVAATMKEINQELDQSIKSAEDSKTAKEAEIQTAEKYIQALKDMQSGENTLAQNKQQVLFYIGEINKILPDANLKYNEQTGAIEGLNTALTNNISLMKQKVALDMYQEQYTALERAALAVKGDLDESNNKIAKLQANKAEEMSDYQPGAYTQKNYALVEAAYDQEIEKEKKKAAELKKAYDEKENAAQDLYNTKIKGAFEGIDKDTQTNTTYKTLSDFYSSSQLSASGAKDLSTGLSELGTALQNVRTGTSMSMDDMLRLTTLYPELASKVNITSGGYSIEAKALQDVALAEQNKVIAQQLGATTTSFAQTATQGQKDELAKLVQNLNSAKDAEAKLSAQTAIYMFLAKNAKGSTGDFATELSKLQKLIATSGDILGSDFTKTGISDINQKKIKALQAESKKIQDEKAEEIKKEQKLLKDLKEDYENQIKTVKDYYDTEIEGLKRAKEERDRSRQREDMQADIEYWSKRTGVEATDKLAEAKKKLAESEDDWDNEDEIQSLEDLRDYKVKNLENERDIKIKEHEETIERLQNEAEASKEKYEQDIENAQNAAAGIKGAGNDIVESGKRNAQDYANAWNTSIKDIEGNVYHLADVFRDWRTEAVTSLSLQVRNNIDAALTAISEYKTEMQKLVDNNASWSERTRLFNQNQSDKKAAESFGWYPSSHTGSIVAKEGLVNVAPGEVIIRPDVTAGLLKMMNDYNQRVASVTNNSFFNTTNNNNGVPNINYNFNAPLSNIEKQEINDGADRQLSENQLNRVLTKALSKVTR